MSEGETKQTTTTWQVAFDNNISELTNDDDETDNRASVMGQIKQKFQDLLGRIQEENGNVEVIEGHIERLTQLIAKLRECWTQLQRIIEELKRENGQGAEELRKLRNLVDKKPNLNLIRETLIEMIGSIKSNNTNATKLGSQLGELSGLIDNICSEAELTRTNLEERAQQAQARANEEEANRKRQEAKLAEDRQRAQQAQERANEEEANRKRQEAQRQRQRVPEGEKKQETLHMDEETVKSFKELLSGILSSLGNNDLSRQDRADIRSQIIIAYRDTILKKALVTCRLKTGTSEGGECQQTEEIRKKASDHVNWIMNNLVNTRRDRMKIKNLKFDQEGAPIHSSLRGGWRDNTQLKSLSMTKPIRSLRSLKKKKKKRTKKHKRKNKGRKTRNKKRRRKKTKKFRRR